MCRRQRSQTIGNVIAVLPNGTVVDVFTQIDYAVNAPARATLNALVSVDKGGSWSGPFRIADALAVGARDPDTGASIRDGGSGSLIGGAGRGGNAGSGNEHERDDDRGG